MLFLPIGMSVVVAMLLGIFRALFHREISKTTIIAIWAGLATLVFVWGVLREPKELIWTLTAIDLRRGRKRNDLVISFDEIQSIVIGLPEFQSAARLQFLFADLVTLRRGVLLLRLAGGRLMALNLNPTIYRNGVALMDAFLRLNATKVIGAESYTPVEVQALNKPILNRIVRA